MTFNIPDFAGIHALIFDVDRIPYLIIAILLSMVVGMVTGPRDGNANPMIWIWIDKIFGALGDKLDRKERKKADLMFRGFIIMAVAVLLFGVLGEICKMLAVEYAYYGLTHAVLVSLALSGGGVWFVLLRLYFALEKKEDIKKGAFYGIARTSRINLNSTDDYGITRVGMTLAARSFDKGVVAPSLWYLIGGFPAMFVYAAVAALAWRFGKDGFTKGFGAVPLAIEKLLGIVPMMITTLLFSAASVITPVANITKTVFSWVKSGAPYEQGGHPVTALAWALNITLGGPAKDLNASVIKSEWVGPKGATAKVDHKHLKLGIYMNVMAHLLLIAALLGAYLWGSAFSG